MLESHSDSAPHMPIHCSSHSPPPSSGNPDNDISGTAQSSSGKHSISSQDVQRELTTHGPDNSVRSVPLSHHSEAKDWQRSNSGSGDGDTHSAQDTQQVTERTSESHTAHSIHTTHSRSDHPDDAEKADTVVGNDNDKNDDNNGEEVVEKEKRTDGLDDQTNLMPKKLVIVVFIGVSASLFCSLLDQTIVSTILPDIASEFQAAGQANWVATSYLLTSTAVITFWSRLSDLIGRKWVLQINLIIFFFGSMACALSTNITMLIGFRALAGLGGGGILNNVMVIISDIVSLRERGKYQGILGSVVAVSNSLGPVLGGVFSSTIGWKWAFWINLPLTGIAIIVVQFFLPFKPLTGNYREKLKRIDYIGTLLILASTTLVLLSLNWGGNEYAWDSGVVIALLVVGVFLMAVFIFVEGSRFIDLPILPMYLFRDISVSASYTCTFFSGLIFYGALYFLPQYLQVVEGFTPLRSGVVLLGLILTQTLFAFTAGMIVSKTGKYRINIWSGFAVWTVGLGLFTMLSPSTDVANFVGYSVISGVGAGNTFQTTLISVQAAVKRQDLAVATGGRNFIRLLGGTIGLALCDVILRNTLIVGLRGVGTSEGVIEEISKDPTRIRNVDGIDASQVLSIYCDGIRNIFILFTAASGASFLISLLIRHFALDRPDDKILKQEGKEWSEQRKQRKQDKRAEASRWR